MECEVECDRECDPECDLVCDLECTMQRWVWLSVVAVLAVRQSPGQGVGSTVQSSLCLTAQTWEVFAEQHSQVRRGQPHFQNPGHWGDKGLEANTDAGKNPHVFKGIQQVQQLQHPSLLLLRSKKLSGGKWETQESEPFPETQGLY